MIPKDWKANKIVMGAVLGIFTLAFVFSNVSYTQFTVGSIVGDYVTEQKGGEPTGTRFFLFGEHIHHYVFGLIIMAVSLFYLVKTKWRKYAPIAFGFGLILFVDQLPHLIGLRTFGV